MDSPLERGDVVAVSDGVEPGGADALVLRALAPGAPVVARIERLPGAITALAAGDTDGDGHPEILMVVRDRAALRTELWTIE